MTDHCWHPTSFGVQACCTEHDGKACELVRYSPLPLLEKTHGFSQRQLARMEIAATRAVQAVAAPLIRAAVVSLIPFRMVPPREKEPESKPNLVFVPGQKP